MFSGTDVSNIKLKVIPTLKLDAIVVRQQKYPWESDKMKGVGTANCTHESAISNHYYPIL